MLRELLDLLSNIEGLTEIDLPIFFEKGSEVNGVAFIEWPHGPCPECPSIMIY